MLVRLRVWGSTQQDADAAERAAREAMADRGHTIVEVIPTVGGQCPIPRRDPVTLDGGRQTGQVWAAYQTGQGLTLERTHAGMAAALAPLGIEVGIDVLGIWRDRERGGGDPLPEGALRAVSQLVEQLLREKGSGGPR